MTRKQSYPGRAPVCVVICLMMFTSFLPVFAGKDRETKVVIPKIANIAGIKVGYSSMEELEAHIGKGKAVTGGHPNGARIWRVKGTSWGIYADAFDYSRRGTVVDSFDITVLDKPDPEAPFTRLRKKQFAWLGKVTLGMDEEALLEIFKRNSWTAFKTAEGWSLTAKGRSPLTSITTPFEEWTTTFAIKDRALVRIALFARTR